MHSIYYIKVKPTINENNYIHKSLKRKGQKGMTTVKTESIFSKLYFHEDGQLTYAMSQPFSLFYNILFVLTDVLCFSSFHCTVQADMLIQTNYSNII